MNELDLFAAAIALADPEERAALLERECAGRPELRQRLEQLVAAHFQPNALLDESHEERTRTSSLPGSATESVRTASEAEGAVIAGRYKLLQQIGEGGMGSVWMAEQTEPVKRRVAVKLIRVQAATSRTILARFEAERQAIALMDHPHIARLLDAGTTSDGLPFFAMELVKGVPLNEYCDTHRLSIRDRLQLFTQVCSAVQHAHQKGIIHRDLKPTNVLVESHDGKPVPKVIDFGLAKATSGMRLSENTLFTAFCSVVGTPLYMAPEQASFNAIDVDTRADVYALGVILYELLTGTTPILRESMKKAALDEMLRLIRDYDAPTPSSRLLTASSTPSVAANRQTEPAKLGRLVKGDLDWIVMKSLSKERHRRYETANGFARDVERFLSDEPVTAGPPSAAYRFKKFVRRNRGRVIAAVLVLLALVAGLAGTAWGLFEARKQTRSALTAAEQERRAKLREATERLRAEAGEKQAKEEKANAERNLAYARKGNEILGSVFAGLDPKQIAESQRPLQDVLRENLAQAVKELEGSAIGDPLEVAAMQDTLGRSLLGLGETNQAIAVFEKALNTRKARLGPDHPDTFASMNSLAVGYAQAGQLDRALPLADQTLNLRKARLGPDHPDTLASMGNLATSFLHAGQLDRALPLLEETLTLSKSKLGADHPDTLSYMNNLASAYQAAGQVDRALPLYEETLRRRRSRLVPEHPDILNSMHTLAGCYRAAGQLDRALPLYEETLKLTKSRLGPDHPHTLTSMAALAHYYQTAGQYDRALPLLEQTLALCKAKLGPDHPQTLNSLNDLAVVYENTGRIDRALPLHEESVGLMKARLGPEHPSTLTSMNNLALDYQAAGQVDRAVALLEQTLELRKAKLGPDHPDTATSIGNLARAYQASVQTDRALPLFEETLRLKKAKLGPVHPETLKAMNNLAAGYWRAQQLDRSIPLFEEALQLQEKKLGRQHPDTLTTVANLGVNYKDAGRLPEALPLLEEAYQAGKRYAPLRAFGAPLLDGYAKAGKPAEAARLSAELLADTRRSLPAESPQLAAQLAQFALSLLKTKGFAEAEPLLRECLAIRERTQRDAWTTFNTMSLLGEALVGQKKCVEAEALLLAGYEGMKRREKTIPPQGSTRIPEALDRLIELGTITNKTDEVKKWQAERAKYPEAKSAHKK